jgi:hypothetical protein
VESVHGPLLTFSQLDPAIGVMTSLEYCAHAIGSRRPQATAVEQAVALMQRDCEYPNPIGSLGGTGGLDIGRDARCRWRTPGMQAALLQSVVWRNGPKTLPAAFQYPVSQQAHRAQLDS